MMTPDLVASAQGSPVSLERSSHGTPSDVRGWIAWEYLEMPGLTLTLQQAARLWALPLATAANVLDDLVNNGFLIRTHDGRYRRI